MKITIRHEINFITSTITIIIIRNGINWDVREYSFECHVEMRNFITSFEAALNMMSRDWKEEIIYITK